MEAYTSFAGKFNHIMWTKGDLIGDSSNLIVNDFLQAVYQEDKSLLSSSIEDSMQSHYVGFKAEESWNGGGQVVNI